MYTNTKDIDFIVMYTVHTAYLMGRGPRVIKGKNVIKMNKISYIKLK